MGIVSPASLDLGVSDVVEAPIGVMVVDFEGYYGLSGLVELEFEGIICACR